MEHRLVHRQARSSTAADHWQVVNRARRPRFITLHPEVELESVGGARGGNVRVTSKNGSSPRYQMNVAKVPVHGAWLVRG